MRRRIVPNHSAFWKRNRFGFNRGPSGCHAAPITFDDESGGESDANAAARDSTYRRAARCLRVVSLSAKDRLPSAVLRSGLAARCAPLPAPVPGIKITYLSFVGSLSILLLAISFSNSPWRSCSGKSHRRSTQFVEIATGSGERNFGRLWRWRGLFIIRLQPLRVEQSLAVVACRWQLRVPLAVPQPQTVAAATLPFPPRRTRVPALPCVP